MPVGISVEDAFLWPEIRTEQDTDGNIKYLGRHKTFGATDNDGNWYIEKYTFTNNNLSSKRGPVIGAWANRGTLIP